LQRLVKRLLDVAVTVLVLVALVPLWLALAAAIKLESPGPVFFRQLRSGKAGRLFLALKFRSMTVGAEEEGLGHKVAHDDIRLTRMGRLLRRFALDELPQLLNVLRGEMSLVGPRPTLPSQVERYTQLQRRRLEVAPGLTGWAQVNGRNSISWDQRIELDLWYVDHWNLWLDSIILLRTIPEVLLATQAKLYGTTGITPDL
jgi:lipopolysaccharide/colanic/teichoic acid biosynthesis glycosyltransferase